MALSLKHQQFINEYLQCWNGTEAYRRVYPRVGAESARRNASRLLTNADVSDALRARIAENAMGADEVLARLADHARGTMEDFISVGAESASLDLDKAQRAGRLNLVRKFTRTTRTFGDTTIEEVTVELYDAQSALEKLGKAHKLFTDRVELGDGTIAVVNVDTDRL